MSESNKNDTGKKVLSLSGRGKLGAKKPIDADSVRQSFTGGRSKSSVTVEVKRKRQTKRKQSGQAGGLSDAEREARMRALELARQNEEKRKVQEAEDAKRRLEEAAERQKAEAEAQKKAQRDTNTSREALSADELRAREIAEIERINTEAQAKIDAQSKAHAEAQAKKKAEAESRKKPQKPREQKQSSGRSDNRGDRKTDASKAAPKKPAKTTPQQTQAPADNLPGPISTDEDRRRGKKGVKKKGAADTANTRATPRSNERRSRGRMDINSALDAADGITRTRSQAAMRRAQQKRRMQEQQLQSEREKIIRDVTLPETITVQELANRMAERGAEVVKTLMKLGIMATINQSIDADTAELVVEEMGHRCHRVSEADVETSIAVADDTDADLKPRAPVVTVMGHVDHGKTSLLDALRTTDVVSKEAGGITQHIGAYQVTLPSEEKITFIDTPGHAAFTEMRSRGADVTDIVVLVVAANDSIMPQTVEAINHAKAAGVPIIVAINKCDLPEANAERVRQDLLQHELVVEEMGGDILAVEVSAKKRIGLDKLEEAILLQAEILELRANPNRAAVGAIIEAKQERGRGSVATVLIQRGTLKQGDIFVAGSEWGRVRLMLNDRNENISEATPGMPVEVLGLNGVPNAGDEFVVVNTESKAREVAEYRQRRSRELMAAKSAPSSLEDMFAQIKAGDIKELPIIIKGDVQGSIEAISSSLEKITEGNEEVKVRVLQQSVGAINESDVILANASNAIMVGFNVRANPQARDLAKREGVEIRYYSVIYNIIDDVKAALSGLLSPEQREEFLGYAEIREVFNITKVGKVAGCMVTEGIIKRGAGVRLLRDNVVIHEGNLKTLKRFKDEVKEVKDGYECGMAFEKYDDIKAGDIIEAFEITEIQRTL